MVVISSLALIVYSITNVNAFLALNKKKDNFLPNEQKQNTNYVFLRWLLLIVINAVVISVIPISNLYFGIHGEQTLIDSLATIGFVITILVSIFIYLYILRFKKVVNITHSLGIVLVYSIEYTLILMLCVYFIIN